MNPGTRRFKQVWQVLIVEDDPEMRAFFAASVRRCDQLELACSAGSVADACEWLGAPARRVDVLLADLGLPDGSGLDVIRFAQLRHPECECLVISMFGDEENVLASIEAGVLGYIHKDAAPEDIAHTILEMKAGGSPISPMIARRVLAKYLTLKNGSTGSAPPAPKATPPHTPVPAPKSTLSEREQSVLEWVARGFSYAEIARRNHVSVHTVQSHIKNIYSKLAVHSKNAAVYEATRLGLLPQRDFVASRE
jgi:DNA-binding NarL/FixJ family response regulator